MEWSDEFFAERRLTSKLKHLVLRRYVKEFAYHLGSVNPTVYYVDGFAGAGVYTGPPREEGSPLLIARLARDLRSGPNAVALRCINVEADKGRFESLQSATQEFIPDIVAKNIRSTFVEAIPEVLSLIGDAAAFFFIDPFGTKDIPFGDLLPIFQRKARTEVLITLHTDGIAKKAGWFAKLESPVVKDRENARKLTEHLAVALDIPLAKLRAGWEGSIAKGGTAAFEERVRRWYIQRLRNPKRTRFECSQSFKVLYRPDRHSSSVCFHLVFGTQKEIGLFKMNNAMAGALEDFYADVYRGTLFPEYTEEREQEIGRKAMRREILRQFATTEFTIDDVKRHGMQETDYVLKEGEYRDVVFEMRRQKEVIRIDSGPISKKSRFRVVRGVQP
jgi:three-Cys-motif partner protein